MRSQATQWSQKAERDFASMERGVRDRLHPTHGIVCFIAFHAARDYAMAILTEAGRKPSIARSAKSPIEMLIDLRRAWTKSAVDIAQLAANAVGAGYPGRDFDRDMALDSARRCRRFRAAARAALGLK